MHCLLLFTGPINTQKRKKNEQNEKKFKLFINNFNHIFEPDKL